MPTKEELQDKLNAAYEDVDRLTDTLKSMCHASALSDAHNKLTRVVEEKEQLQARIEIYEEALQSMALRIKMMIQLNKNPLMTPSEAIKRWGYETGNHEV